MNLQSQLLSPVYDFDRCPQPLPDAGLKKFEPLFHAVREIATLNRQECLLLAESFEEIRVKRKHYFLKEGDRCRHLAFIAAGSMRMFTTNDKGYEHIVSFGLEGCWMMDYESFLLKSPSVSAIEALEDSTLLVISHHKFDLLLNTVPGFAQLIDRSNRKNVIAAQRRIHAAIGLSAEEKFLALFKSYPAFLNRFPQIMIASYLGITAETLSRIRRQIWCVNK